MSKTKSQLHGYITHNFKFTGTHLNTWVERGTVRVKCLTEEHNAMSLARVWTQTTQSQGKHTNRCTSHTANII